MPILGGVILVAGPVRLKGQWAYWHFGWTHAELIASFVLGAVAFFVGYDYKENRVHIGQLLGGLVAAGAIVTYLVLVGRGVGD